MSDLYSCYLINNKALLIDIACLNELIIFNELETIDDNFSMER